MLEELREGGTNAEIAARLGISGDAVKYHISNMLGKLDLRDRSALASWRPRRRRSGLIAILGVLGGLGRPVTWVGTGAAVAGGVAVVSVAAMLVISVVATQGDGAGPAVVEVPVAVTRQPDPVGTPIVPVPATSSTPTATPAPSPTPTATPTPSVTPAPHPTPRPQVRIAPSPTPTPGPELAPGQAVVFVEDVPEEDQAAVRDELGHIVAFFDDRFGIEVPEFTFYFGMDLGPVAARYKELHGREAPFVDGHGGGWALGLLDGTTEVYAASSNRERTAEVLAHEYYHLLQYHILRLGEGPRSAPAWLIEGTAGYAEALYTLRDGEGHAEFLSRWEALANTTPILHVVDNLRHPWAELIHGRPIGLSLEPAYYPLAASAVAWLVDRAVDDAAHLSYWRLLAELGDSDEAFASAFGISADEFVEAFEEDRAESAQGLPEVSGTITDLAGNPLPGVHLGVRPAPPSELTAESFARHSAFLARDAPDARATTSSNGTFSVPVLPGWHYGISLAWTVPASSDDPVNRIYYGLSVDPQTGVVNQCGPLSFLEVRDEDVTDVAIHVSPDLLTRTEQPPCGEGVQDSVTLSGSILGPDGQPAESIYVCAEGDVSFGAGSCADTGPDGQFALQVQPGDVRLRVGGYDKPVGWYADGGWVGNEWRATVIRVGAAGVANLSMAIPAVVSGTVILRDPDAPGHRSAMVCVEPHLEADRACVQVSLENGPGRFAFAVPSGPFSLRIWRHAGWMGWYGDGGVVTDEDERTVIHGDQLHIFGIEIALPW